jgi:hypothetical protein
MIRLGPTLSGTKPTSSAASDSSASRNRSNGVATPRVSERQREATRPRRDGLVNQQPSARVAEVCRGRKRCRPTRQASCRETAEQHPDGRHRAATPGFGLDEMALNVAYV